MAPGKRAANDAQPTMLEPWDAELDAADLDLSSSEEEADDSEVEADSGSEDGDADLADAVQDYVAAVQDGSGSEGEEGLLPDSEAGASGSDSDLDDLPAAHDDPATDSSEDERPNRNTVGEVPLEWYRDEEHIGYDADGKRVVKQGRRDALERLLARNDSAKDWRTVYDEYNDEEIVLSKEEVRMIQRIHKGQFPHVEVNPFEEEVDWFTRDVEVMPLSGAPEPKRRFVPSKWEEKKVVKLVRALRKGWLKHVETEEKPEVYLMWEDDGKVSEKAATGLSYIPAPKLKLPGHAESYNPPKEYLLSEEERAAAEGADPEDRPSFLPAAYDALRRVPAYAAFIKERFERCLDLYLCPRTRIKRLNVDDPESLVPRLPRPKDLQPFPTLLALRFVGHEGPVRSVAPHTSGQWLLSGSADGSVRLWEVRTGRCLRAWELGESVACVSWCPDPALQLAAAAAGSRLVLLPTETGEEEQTAATAGKIEAAVTAAAAAAPANEAAPAVLWRPRDGGGAELELRFPVRHVAWHSRGDYFATAAPTGNTQAVLVHQLSRGASQNPFRKNRGRLVRALFHPTKPFFFVATQQAVRVYNLAKQSLAKKLIGGSGVITSMDVHPSGDHLIVGAEDKRLAWYDLDLSAKPYRSLRYHTRAVRGAAFHRSYPLFASASDDATAHVFHGMVYADLMTNPLIVPVKILRGHREVGAAGVLDLAFHPTQPWLFTAGADATVCLFVNP